jgi:hypothetical protein
MAQGPHPSALTLTLRLDLLVLGSGWPQALLLYFPPMSGAVAILPQG